MFLSPSFWSHLLLFLNVAPATKHLPQFPLQNPLISSIWTKIRKYKNLHQFPLQNHLISQIWTKIQQYKTPAPILKAITSPKSRLKILRILWVCFWICVYKNPNQHFLNIILFEKSILSITIFVLPNESLNYGSTLSGYHSLDNFDISCNNLLDNVIDQRQLFYLQEWRTRNRDFLFRPRRGGWCSDKDNDPTNICLPRFATHTLSVRQNIFCGGEFFLPILPLWKSS